MNCDMQFINYGLSQTAWDSLQDAYKQRMLEHPICELCRNNKTERVTPLGAIRACCNQCAENVWREVNEATESEYD